MKKDNEIYKNADKAAENEKVVKGGEKEVVKGGENADTNLDSALDLENAKKLNREIGRRIIEIREGAGMSQEKFYSLLYPDSEEADTRKATRMGYIENAVAFDRDKNGKKISGAILLDFPRLLFISQHFNVPLNDLLYGKAEPTTETPPVSQEEKAATEKAELKNIHKNNLIDSISQDHEKLLKRYEELSRRYNYLRITLSLVFAILLVIVPTYLPK